MRRASRAPPSQFGRQATAAPPPGHDTAPDQTEIARIQRLCPFSTRLEQISPTVSPAERLKPFEGTWDTLQSAAFALRFLRLKGASLHNDQNQPQPSGCPLFRQLHGPVVGPNLSLHCKPPPPNLNSSDTSASNSFILSTFSLSGASSPPN